MNLIPISFYKASRHDKTLVTVSGPQLRAAGIPAPLEKNASITLTLCYNNLDDEETQTPVTFRVNRAPGKTLCSHHWPSELPHPECGNSLEGIEGKPVTVPVYYTHSAEPVAEETAPVAEQATPVDEYEPAEAAAN